MVSKEGTRMHFYQGFGGAFVFIISLDFLLHGEEWGLESLSIPIILLLIFGLTNMLYAFVKAFIPEFRLKIRINWRIDDHPGNEYEEAIVREVLSGLDELTSSGKDDKPKRST